MKASIAVALVTFCVAFGLVASSSAHNPTVIAVHAPQPAADARFGESVAGIGDVNGDGTSDFVVGAPGANRAFVFSGANRTLIRTIQDPANLAGTRFGYAVASAGDVNGDAVDDIAVGAPGPDGLFPLPCGLGVCPDPNWGRAFVFSGATGTLLRTLLPADQDFLLFGFSLAPLGDVNGDGTPDLAVGAPVLLKAHGEVYAFSGASGAQLWNTAEPVPPLPQKQAIASFGAFMAPIGDVTGDGRGDLLVGAHFHEAGTVIAGRAYVLSGASGAIVRTHDNPSSGTEGIFGAGVSGAGDQNGDGVGDYAIGNARAGVVRVYSGANGSLLKTISSPGSTSTDSFGWSIAQVGDKDGDGRADLWIGAPMSGQMYLVNSAGSVLAQIPDPTPDPSSAGGGFGWRISAIGNLGGDAGDDLVVGDPTETVSGSASAGAAFVVMLPPPNRPPALATAQPVVTTNEGGIAVASGTASDPDGDSFSLTASIGTVTNNGDGTWSWSFATTEGPSESQTVTITGTDEHAATATTTFKLVVANVAPAPATPSAPDSALLGKPVPVTDSFSDPGVLDTHTCSIDWGDGSATPGVVVELNGSGACSGTHTYATVGHKTITVTVTDDDGGAASSSVEIVVYSAMSLKQDVLAQTNALLADATIKDADKLQDVVKKLEVSLDPSLWIDGNHVEAKHGNKVFDREKEAVGKLADLVKKSSIPATTLQDMIDTLVHADTVLAEEALADAIASAGDPKAIADAQKELNKAADELALGHIDMAIDDYKNAWKKAQDAV